MDNVRNYSLKDSGYITWECPCCKKPINKDEELWVRDEVGQLHNVYHFKCYNEMKAEENKK